MNTENKEASRKDFDSTICFTFYGSWIEAITSLETDADRCSPAYMLFKAIANYSMYDEEPSIDDDNSNSSIIKVVWPILEKEIDNSVNRRKRGFVVREPTKMQQAVLDLHRERPELSYRQIGNIIGTSKSAVDRLIRKYADRPSDSGAVADDSFSDAGVESYDIEDSDCCSGDYSAAVIDSIETGQRDTNRSPPILDIKSDTSVWLDDGDLPF